MAHEGDAHRLPADDAVVAQVAERDLTAALAQVARERPRQLAVVEVLPAGLGEPLERLPEVGEHEPVAGDQAVAVHAVHRVALVGVAQDRVEDVVQVRLALGQLDPVAGVRDRRLEQHPPGQRAEAAMGFAEPGRRSRDGAEAAPIRKNCDDSGVKSIPTLSIGVWPWR